MHLTKKFITELKGGEKRIRKSDGDGLYIIVEPNGRKYFALEVRLNGKIKRFKLGDFPKLSLTQARELAKIKKSEQLSYNFDFTSKNSIVNNQQYNFKYLSEQLLELQSSSLKESSLKTLRYTIEKYLYPYFETRDIRSITRDEIIAFLKTLEQKR